MTSGDSVSLVGFWISPPQRYKEYFDGKCGNMNVDYILKCIVSMLKINYPAQNVSCAKIEKPKC